MDALTICARNYLPFAHLLGNSFLLNHPGSTFTILVIDGQNSSYKQKTQFKYIHPSDLALSVSQIRNMSLYYDVTELATSLKPSALKFLLNQGSQKALYLDPDIEVFSKLNEVSLELDKSPIVLTPHSIEPMPRDGLRPSESDILESGTFNLGFIGINNSSESIRFLDWWEERLKFDSIVDPLQMLFTDQKWIDLVPSYFSHKVIRHAGYNVAYWNLHERKLSDGEDGLLINEVPLRFFHFSGYRPEKPWILSKYVSNKPRVVLSENKILKSLFESYSKKAFDEGWQSEDFVKYGYEDFGERKKIPSSIRRLYREDCIAASKLGIELDPPKNWQEWATSKSLESGSLSRILFSIWKSRPDLQRRFPEATGRDSEGLINWAKKYGVEQNVIDSDLLVINDLEPNTMQNASGNKRGLNLVGYLQGELGVGQSARLILSAAKKIGIPVNSINYTRLTSRQNENYQGTDSQEFFRLTISVINADQFEIWVNDFGPNRLKKKNVIGVWAWETEDFPKSYHKAFKFVDEIWAVSKFVRDSIAKNTNKPVFVIPTPINTPNEIEELNRESIGLPKKAKYNLFIFDYMSVFNRKNPLGLVTAHTLAFPDADGPFLVIKSTNGDKDPENRELLRHAVSNRKDIILIEDYISREQITSLIAECEAYVSLHRSEGYGLTIAEALSLAKPVIATDYSGNLDFMSKQSSILVPYKLIEVGNNSFPYDPKSYWADPDLTFASEQIRHIYLDSKFAKELGAKGQEFVVTNFSEKQASEFIQSRLNYHYSIKGRIFFTYIRMTEKIKTILKLVYRAQKKLFKDVKTLT